jgi:transposase-like protein
VLLHPKQKYKCRDCDKQFVLNPEKKISEEKKAIIDKLLLEKISLRGIARSVGVSTV